MASADRLVHDLLADGCDLAGAIAISSTANSLLLHDGRVSVGHALAGVTLKVVDPITSEELPEDFEGEIWIRSDSTAEGYWLNSQADSSQTFNCSLKGGEPVRQRCPPFHLQA